uniref:Uncharacterized protein n=1 Tax=Hot spring virus BHS1 TaxID=2024351 RepID=A0A2Y9CIC4_9VIRU|nr:hypothetical protein [Hot spring virus BHS1]
MADKDLPTNHDDEVAAIYNGAGEFFGGIPARDLTLAEFEALTPDQRELCATSGLYTITPAGLKLLPESPTLEFVKSGEPFKPKPFALEEKLTHDNQ